MQMLADDNFDLVVLDLNLPDADGMTVLRTLRKTDRDTKVLILSARSEVSDKVDGLDAGANDYLAKPFHLEELAARIRSLTLRQLFSSASAMRTMFFAVMEKFFLAKGIHSGITSTVAIILLIPPFQLIQFFFWVIENLTKVFPDHRSLLCLESRISLVVSCRRSLSKTAFSLVDFQVLSCNKYAVL